jgi:hypothetical protein
MIGYHRRDRALILVLTVLAVCLASTPADAAWSLVQSAKHGFFATSGSKAYTSNVTAGNMLHAAGHCGTTAAPIPGVSDTQGNTWTVVQRTGTQQGDRRLFHAFTIAGSSAANTVTVGTFGAATFCTLFIDEFSGNAPSSLLDVDDPVTGGISATASNAITTATAGALILGLAAVRVTSGSATITPDACCTQIQEEENSAVGVGPASSVYRVATTTTSYTVSWTNDNVAWDVYLISIKPGAVSSGSMLLLGIQ